MSATQPRAPINFYLFQQALAVAAAVDYVAIVAIVRFITVLTNIMAFLRAIAGIFKALPSFAH